MRFPRLEALFGQPIDQVPAEKLEEVLVGGAVHEAIDLEFKRGLYELDTPRAKRELAKDVAAMANAQGGIIVLGVKAKDGVAEEMSRLPLTETKERQMELVIAGHVAPYPFHRVFQKPFGTSHEGLYMIAVPRSTLRPHAVSVDGDALLFPRRQDHTTGYLTESELADAYRNRFREARDDVRRVDQVLAEGISRLQLPLDNGFWLTMALTPETPSDLVLTASVHAAMREWFEKVAMRTMIQGGISFGVMPQISTRLRRLCLAGGVTEKRPMPRNFYSELHTDGSGFLARSIPQRSDASRLELQESTLVQWAHGALQVLTEHARRSGAHGDAIVRTNALVQAGDTGGTLTIPLTLVGTDVAAYHPVSDQALDRFIVDGRTVNLDDCADTRGLLLTTRLVLTDIFQACGVAEVQAISNIGTLALRYYDWSDRARLKDWASGNGVAFEE